MKTTLSLLAALAAALAVTAVVLKTSSESGGPAAIASKSEFKGAPRPKNPARNFTLRDYQGKEVSLYSGSKVVAVTFVYSHCKETCPLQAQLIRKAIDELGAQKDQVRAVAVSVDPKGDTPASVRKFIVKNRVDGLLHYLLGSKSRLQPVWSEFGIQPQEVLKDHSAYIILLDRKRRQRVGHNANITTAGEISHDLKILINENTGSHR